MKFIGSWPLLVRIGVIALSCIVVIVLIVYFDISKQSQRIAQEQNNEIVLQRQLADKYQQSVHLPAHKLQLNKITKVFDRMLIQLPKNSNTAKLINDISQEAVASGLIYRAIVPMGAENKEFFIEYPLQLSMSGSYHGFGEFFSNLSKLGRVITFHELNFSRTVKQGTNIGTIVMDVKAKIYAKKQAVQ